tara:strand:+ start:996 stop:1316 length:321 start_codon:yes stop_codon:yes gene_type:complete
MIVNKYKKDDIITLKLVSSEEVITKVVEASEDSFTVSKPLMLIHTPKGVAMSQFLMMQDIDDTIVLPMSQIVAVTKANSVASSQYSQTISSIKVPTPEEKSSIIQS